MGTDHHPLGGSSAWRTNWCPPSARISEAAERDGWAVAGLEKEASLGTEMHELMAMRLKGQEWPEDGYQVEAYSLAESCVDWLKRHESFTAVRLLHVEERLDIADSLTGEVLSFGTCDLCYAGKARRLHVVDWKSGEREDEADSPRVSAQLRDYLLAAIQAYGSITAGGSATAYYPKSDYAVTVIFEGLEAVAEYETSVIRRVRRAADPAEVVNPGKWCRLCPGAARCPATLEVKRNLVVAKEHLLTMSAKAVGKLAAECKDSLDPAMKMVMKRARDLESATPGCTGEFEFTERHDRSADVEIMRGLFEEELGKEAFRELLSDPKISVAQLEAAWCGRLKATGDGRKKAELVRAFKKITAGAIKTKVTKVFSRSKK